MQFVDRKDLTSPPIKKLNEFNTKYKTDWADYNTARANGIKPLPKRPSSAWLHDEIRNPLKQLFLKNCAYCGIYTDVGNDAEVDHYFPTSLDINADHVFDWENYLWSCHSCNTMKSNQYPFLNPCLKSDMDKIYFHEADGRYLYYADANDDLKSKFELTSKYSNLNIKKRPEQRKLLFRNVIENHLSGLKRLYELYEIEKDIQGSDSRDAKEKLALFNEKKKEFLDLIKCGNFLYLIKFAFDYFCKKEEFVFPFTFEELLHETGDF